MKFPKLPAVYVPTLVSLKAGNGATKLDTTILEVPIPKLISSVISIATDPVDPGLLTEVTFKPIALVRVLPTSDADFVELPPFALTFEKLYDSKVLFVVVSMTSTAILIGTAQLFVSDKFIVPPEKETLEKLPRLPPLKVPTLVSATAGKGATKLDATMFAVEIPKPMESDRLMFTDPEDPGLVTEVIFRPKLLGSVFPARELVCVEEPPLAETFKKLNDKIVLLVAVSTRSTPILKGTGQSLVSAKLIVPDAKIALVKFPRLPPL